MGRGGVPAAWLFLGAVTLLLLFVAPRRNVGRVMTGTLAFLVAGVGLVFLPRAVSGGTWRQTVEELLGYSLGPWIVSQPWMWLRWLPVYLALIGYIWWLLNAGWSQQERRNVGTFLAALGVTLALMTLFSGAKGWWFESRNQLGNFFALTAPFALAFAADGLRGRRSLRIIIGLAAFVLITAAAFSSGSRAAAAFIGLGSVVFLGLWAGLRRRPAVLAVGVLACSLLFAFWVLFGGTTVERVRQGMQEQQSFRLLVQSDALRMTEDTMATGVGLGNFDAIFVFYRQDSIRDYRTTHPENDWLFLAAECGWPVALAAVLAAGLILINSVRTVARSPAPFRIAGAVAGLLLLIHTFVDQSAHEAANLSVAMLGLSLAVRSRHLATPGLIWAQRLAGVALCLLFFGVLRLLHDWPATLPANGPVEELPQALTDSADDWVRVSPLHWRAHELLAHEFLRQGQVEEAWREFRLVERLEPFSVGVAESEIRAWMAAGYPDRAITAMRLSLARSTEELRRKRLVGYLQMLANRPDLQAALREPARVNEGQGGK